MVGIGLNWRNPVPDQAINLVTITEQSPSHHRSSIHSLEKLTALTLLGLENGYRFWQTQGIHPLLPDYLDLIKIYPQASQPIRQDLAKRLGL